VTGVAESPFTGHGVTVAVLDTGIDAEHEAFQGVELIQQDFTGEGNGDGHGHGTHCGGIIFGQKVNGFRFSVAPGVRRALIGKVLASDGSGSTE
jgi:subtilisin family serine protease